jgi:hypothetical protein
LEGVTNDATKARRPETPRSPAEFEGAARATKSLGLETDDSLPGTTHRPTSRTATQTKYSAMPALRFSTLLLASLALLQGCKLDPAPIAAPSTAPQAAAEVSSRPAESGALGPLQRYALPASERTSFDATVIERVDAGSYGYLRVQRDGNAAPTWVVTMRPSVGVGTRVHVTAFGRARNFDSKRLGRRFDDLYFAAVRRA